ncbi:MAG: hypothetical protein ACLQAH_02300 [Limisphaerales bacterium]
MNETPKNNRGWRMGRRALIGLAIFATLIAIFYTEEDWRGKRAWENCKRELEAKGMVLDWDKFIPPPLPDDQNFFKASKKIAFSFIHSRNYGEADLYAKQPRFKWDPYEKNNTFPVFDTTNAGPIVVATITVISPGSGTLESTSNRLVLKFNDPGARREAGELIQDTIGRSANGSQGFKFSEFQLTNLTPVQIILQADPTPSVAELENFIPADTATNIGHLRVEATGAKGIFHVLLTGVRITAAADYLKWSDQYEPDFDEIREALKRPYAQIDSDYSRPYEIQTPNFVMMRSLAQTLAQRTQCYLLLGQPEKALRELTLLNDSRRILEGGPTGKPMTLVAAMINVAITGVYVETLADGVRWHTWQEPQLALLQEQLKEINVVPFVMEAFRTEPAALCRTFEIAPLPKLFSTVSTKMDWSWSVPHGWVYQNMVNIALLHQKPLSGFDQANNTVSPRVFDDASRDANNLFSHKSPYNFLAAIGNPNYVKAQQATAHNQTLANEAQIVCALERYRLAHGEYPETLDALIPQFIEKLPHDIIGGRPLHYHRTADGKFLLYSVGWNETDDGGQVALKKDGSEDREKGDWVWKN